jgi:hypothetical protein
LFGAHHGEHHGAEDSRQSARPRHPDRNEGRLHRGVVPEPERERRSEKWGGRQSG